MPLTDRRTTRRRYSVGWTRTQGTPEREQSRQEYMIFLKNARHRIESRLRDWERGRAVAKTDGMERHHRLCETDLEVRR